MHMLVGVNVRELQAAGLQLGNLGSGFGLDFGLAESCAAKALQTTDPAEKFTQRGPELPGCGDGKMRNLMGGREHGLSIDQNHVAPDAERGQGQGLADGFTGGAGLSHQGGAGENPHGMQLGYSLIDSQGQSEVVRVDNQLAHHGESINFTEKFLEGRKLPAAEAIALVE